jgi:cell division protein FtsN
MASAGVTESSPHGNRLFVLALGLLIGFVIGFVILLSRLPVDGSLNDYSAMDVSSKGYQFYSVLQEQTVSQRATAAVEPSTPVITIPPATRIVPGSVQSLSARALASESYAEIPASSLGQESYYLQTGNFQRADDAERSRAALLLLGLDAFIVVRQDNNGIAGYRVRIGPYHELPGVNDVKERLRRNRINYKLIRVTG